MPEATGDVCNALHISARDADAIKSDLPAVNADDKGHVEAGEDPKEGKRAKLPTGAMEHIRKHAIASEIDQIGMPALMLSTEALDTTAKLGTRAPLLISENDDYRKPRLQSQDGR